MKSVIPEEERPVQRPVNPTSHSQKCFLLNSQTLNSRLDKYYCKECLLSHYTELEEIEEPEYEWVPMDRQENIWELEPIQKT